ncbi:hypothetical protein EAH80_04285 [Mycobacterium hodleri]|uniref:Transposase n=1 Tax=Mycolicibacterium hodleri TaxID=49897 RepID=A0A502EH81_9MYCO|nr:hypothetical protein EAH80_04285 [Mycolicibacterium hodleri]
MPLVGAPPPHGQRSQWATSTANKFRKVARKTENPNTKRLAEGWTYLAEATRDLYEPRTPSS